MEEDRLAEIRAWFERARQGDYTWMRSDDVADLLEAVEWRDTDRLAPFSDREKTCIAVALALLSIEMTTGVVGGRRASPEELASELPLVVKLVDEIARDTGLGGIDPLVQGGLAAVLDQRAAESADE